MHAYLARATFSKASRGVSSLLPASRLYATEASATPKTLLFLEHRQGKLNPGSLNALTAANALGGEVVALITGDEEGAGKAVDASKKLPLKNIIVNKGSKIAHGLAEPLAPLIAEAVKQGGFTHVVAAHTALGKNVFPRVAALLDVAPISDVQKVISSDTFERPIYAGNAIATVKSSDKIKIFTVRTSAFDAAAEGDGVASVENGSAAEGPAQAEWISEELTVSERPDLGSASRVVSGGRGVKNKENFDSVLTPLADALGAAIGASRAAVDSGYADNSLQVGQTGKVVAPELYVAVGISGAIQHLAGMKDSKTIVAINKDPEAPIFQVADIGLVSDLFETVPQLVEKIKK
ncbi:electron transfer flavoprotein alpha-subunit, mitochondrial precursor [Cystobasidium minutum MCA 4210]|uniref:electron transfer flavoprotein alpha-subunit, mitochondrial precursor n=1 Tax=Cystobasidium minutum MCA 4210 TaxID=1397322 RepID=UPI0034CEBEED|eukprot:jgi/Rhomi1/211208/estExt_Genemark1.C_4_t20354